MNEFLRFCGALMDLLDQYGFCVRDSANAQSEREGVGEERLDRHGLWNWLAGGSARLTPSRSQPLW